MADNLRDILALVRKELPDVPESAWGRIESAIRRDFGTTRPYIAAQRKRAHLDTLANVDASTEADTLAKMLGVSVRWAQQLRKLKRGGNK